MTFARLYTFLNGVMTKKKAYQLILYAIMTLIKVDTSLGNRLAKTCAIQVVV